MGSEDEEDEDEEENDDELANDSGSTSSLDILPPSSKEIYRGSNTTNNLKTKKENSPSINSQKSNQSLRKPNLINSNTPGTTKKHYNRPKELQQPGGSTSSSASAISASRKNLAKFLLTNRNRITDTGEIIEKY